MTPRDIRKRLIAQRIIPVVRLAKTGLTEFAFDCLVSAGFSAIQVPVTVPDASHLIERLVARVEPPVLVGAGAVTDLDTAQRCIDAGARFLVAPCGLPGITRVAHPAGCAVLQGAFTASEVLAAHREGADLVLVFPASSGGPEHVRALRTVLPDVALCPSGGISLQNIEAYFSAGASAVVVGKAILNGRAIEMGDAASAVAHAQRFLTIPAVPPAMSVEAPYGGARSRTR